MSADGPVRDGTNTAISAAYTLRIACLRIQGCPPPLSWGARRHSRGGVAKSTCHRASGLGRWSARRPLMLAIAHLLCVARSPDDGASFGGENHASRYVAIVSRTSRHFGCRDL